MQKGQKQTINLKVPEDVESGQAVNFFQVGSSPYEFYLDLGISVPGIPGGGFKVLFRAFMSPERAKELHQVLGNHIAQYEENFRKIELVRPKEVPQRGPTDLSTSYIG
jgi:hypothetical protein